MQWRSCPRRIERNSGPRPAVPYWLVRVYGTAYSRVLLLIIVVSSRCEYRNCAGYSNARARNRVGGPSEEFPAWLFDFLFHLALGWRCSGWRGWWGWWLAVVAWSVVVVGGWVVGAGSGREWVLGATVIAQDTARQPERVLPVR